jgi:hypothetical protein
VQSASVPAGTELRCYRIQKAYGWTSVEKAAPPLRVASWWLPELSAAILPLPSSKSSWRPNRAAGRSAGSGKIGGDVRAALGGIPSAHVVELVLLHWSGVAGCSSRRPGRVPCRWQALNSKHATEGCLNGPIPEAQAAAPPRCKRSAYRTPSYERATDPARRVPHDQPHSNAGEPEYALVGHGWATARLSDRNNSVEVTASYLSDALGAVGASPGVRVPRWAAAK